jgi:hypothetical protein
MDPRIASAFTDGRILPPKRDEPDLVHLSRALANLSGAERFATASPEEQQVLQCIGEPRHIVFILLDGLGMNLIRKLPAESFLVSNLRRSLRATTPSTTACALTSIATGAWPAQHGVTGWYTYVPARHLSVTTLHMVERFTAQPLDECGVPVEEFLPIPAFHPEMKSTPLTLLPASIADTPYARYSRGGTAFSPYHNLTDASAQILDFVRNASSPTYVHWYVPDVDSACHHYGLSDEKTMSLLVFIDQMLTQLAESLPPDARLVITADHGLLDVPAANHLVLTGEDPLMAMLDAPPSGDGRMPIFHVRSGALGEFPTAFHDQFGDGFVLMSRDDAEALELFGPRPMSPVSRQRFGDFVGIALAPVLLHYDVHREPPPQQVYLAQHAGLTPNELLIPLVVG